jgi:hypothetical protein
MSRWFRDLRRRYFPRKLKWLAVDLYSLARRMQARDRVLPNFLIIGAQKSGTTYLMSALCQSPCILPPALKEVHYFDTNFRKGERWYRGLLPSRREMSVSEASTGVPAITGEASPFYMYYPHAAARAHALSPELKIIAVLRDPTDRAISHYYHSRAWGFETLPIEEAFAAEADRLAPEKERTLRDPDYASKALGTWSYLDRGHYVRQLKTWERLFGRDNMLILDSRRLFAEPQATLAQTCRFLDVPEFDYQGGASKNITSGKAGISQELRQQIERQFQASNDELAAYAGIRF